MLRRLTYFLLLSSACWAQIEIGGGAPTKAIQVQFQSAYYRNGFNRLVSGPSTQVQAFGPTGLVQEFIDASNTSGTRYALVKPNRDSNPSDTDVYDVWQVYPGIYAAYKSQVSTYGYPHMDTTPCASGGDLTCYYQIFDKNYAIFYYTAYSVNGQTFILRDPYFTRWSVNDGLSRMGAAKSAETAVVSAVSQTNATMQSFSHGAIYNITSGTLNGRINAVRSPIYELYAQYGAHNGILGFPVTEELEVAGGKLRQSFEGGAIEYDPQGGAAVLRSGVRSVSITGGGASLQMTIGETRQITATVTGNDGQTLSDRQVNWVTTNGRVATVQGSGLSATIKAVGAGTANITAVVEGKSSSPVQVIVAATCCAVGEGAPNAVVRQAIQDAVNRNKLALRLPTEDPVQRVGNGYVQKFTSANNDSARYWIAVADDSAVAWVVTGPLLQRYLELGGPTGDLGYPTSDATPGGRQLFQNGALAGNPPRVVSGLILTKWASLGYETGRAGSPVSDPLKVLSFAATAGVAQAFEKGNIYAVQSGAQAGHAFFVAGTLLSKYLLLGGPGGSLGLPWGDEYQREGHGLQEFEGGTLDLAPGQSDPAVIYRARTPAVDVQPPVALAGSRVRVAVGGFPDGETVRVSVSGRPDFVVPTQTGAYAWEIYVPVDAASATVRVQATGVKSGATASGSFAIRSLAELKPVLVKVEGDNQVTVPGGLFPRPVRLAVRDQSGRPVIGVTVAFEASPGAQVVASSTVTDASGQAWAQLRAPTSEGVVLCTARIPGIAPTTFSARAAAVSLSSFPRLMQTGDDRIGDGGGAIATQGAMLAAIASVIRYHQDRKDLPSPSGLADPILLNQYLGAFCSVDAEGVETCDGYLAPTKTSTVRIVNPWRVAGFVGGGLTALTDPPTLESVRDALAQGIPPVLALSLTMDGIPAGSHFAVATGIDADGGIQIHDPNPTFARTNLQDYLGGFVLDSHSYKATLTGVLRLVPQPPATTGFVTAASGVRIKIFSPSGVCGNAFAFPGWPALPGQAPAAAPETYQMTYCPGTETLYQLNSDGTSPYRLYLADLGPSGSRFDLFASAEGAFQIQKNGSRWVAAVLEASFRADSVVSAATFAPGIAPGGLAAIFGAGLSREGAKTQVTIAGRPAAVVAASPFQLNVQVPFEAPPGVTAIVVQSPYGKAEQQVEVARLAPAIFVLSGNQGAVANQDGKLNAPTNPAARGQALVIYATGLGAVRSQGSLQVSQEPVTVLISGRELTPFFAGLAPGFVGVYQVNVTIPADFPPGLSQPLTLRQGGVASNPVEVSLQ